MLECLSSQPEKANNNEKSTKNKELLNKKKPKKHDRHNTILNKKERKNKKQNLTIPVGNEVDLFVGANDS